MKFYRWVCSNDGLCKIGDVFEFGKEHSQYYRRLIDNTKSFTDRVNKKTVTYSHFNRNLKSSERPDVVREVEQKEKKAKHAIEREHIFEKVRRDFYNEYPSRKKCGFACASEAEALTWKGDLSLGDATYVQLVELEAFGDVNFVECDDQYLYTNESMNSSEIEKMAHKYWSGNGNKRKEFLLEGRFRITRIIKHNQ